MATTRSTNRDRNAGTPCSQPQISTVRYSPTVEEYRQYTNGVCADPGLAESKKGGAPVN